MPRGASSRVLLPIVAVTVLSAVLAPGEDSAASQVRTLTFEDRVAAQRAIEEVYWKHRIWPNENRGRKPSLDAVMPEAAIRAKVEDYLRKSAALEKWWQRAITGEQLQAELDRMARNTRDPRLLKEIFAALRNDADVIAETLARQTLAERLIRNWYATDERFHGPTRRAAASAVAACESVTCMKGMGGRYTEVTIRRRQRDDANSPDESSGRGMVLDDADWSASLERLSEKFGRSTESIPNGRPSGLEESVDAFLVTAIISRGDDELVTATATWPKVPFQTWWERERGTQSARIDEEPDTFSLPEVLSSGCVNDTWSPTKQEMPDPRMLHTAVWTGTEMIVWGGSGTGPALSSGGRYNPATDTWTSMSLGSNVPVARIEHSAVWTGTEMIVWGGNYYDSTGTTVLLNDGARYDPTNDTWTPISTGRGVPLPRRLHTAVWTGVEMIVWGGNALGSFRTDTGGRYDPAADSWSPTSIGSGVPAARAYHTAVWTGSGMLVWGGIGTSGGLNTGARYDPATDSWKPIFDGTGSPAARYGHTAVWTGSEMIVWGGNTQFDIVLNTGARYDPLSDTWTPTSTAPGVPSGRYLHTAIWTGSTMIVWGGSYFSSGQRWLNTGGRYDPASDSWKATSMGPSVPSERGYQSAVWTGTEMIVWGGFNNLVARPPVGGRYDPQTDTWQPTSVSATVPSARGYHASVWTGAEMIVWGGWDIVSELNTGGRYDPASDSWSPTSIGDDVPSPRSFVEAVWTGSEAIVWGGTGGGVPNTGGRYNPATNTWRPTSTGANVPVGRYGHSLVWTGQEMIVWGGYNSSDGFLSSGGRYDPAVDSWHPTSIGANVPVGRMGHTAVAANGAMIIWGGTSGFGTSPPMNSGGRYEPASDSWTSTSMTGGVPAPRSGHTAIWTGSRMIVWGGRYYAGFLQYLKDGGRYDPVSNAWTPTSTGSSVPSARYDHSAVWTGREMLVWGGSASFGTTNSGGRYDPNTDSWSPIVTGPRAPHARSGHTAVWTGSEMIVWGSEQITASGGRYCACPNGSILYRDADGDGYGNPSISIPSCGASAPAGYVVDATDCDDSSMTVHADAVELCNGVDDDCDGLVDEGPSAEDNDGDGIHDLCDNCPFRPNDSQSDWDHDGEGDACDVDDGVIWQWRDGKTTLSWQAEQGPTSWNVYLGSLGVLGNTGVYTQMPGSNPLADRRCGVTGYSTDDWSLPAAGNPSFSLVTGVTGGIEGSLGENSTGSERPNADPCP